MFISVVYEDFDCVVVDKPAGMPSHPLRDKPGFSALEAVCELYPEIALASSEPLEGGLVHRLDIGTSGLLVFARNPQSYQTLREAFSLGKIEKTYVALVEGNGLKNQVFEYAIAHHPKNKAKMIAVTPKHKYFRGKPQPARTFVAVDGKYVRFRIEGGRRHQIRVHLASIGHPLVGDVLYGAQAIDWREGHALHADSITLPNGKKIVSEVPF